MGTNRTQSVNWEQDDSEGGLGKSGEIGDFVDLSHCDCFLYY